MAGRVGFIGLGRMGRPMVTDPPRNGFDVLVHDIDPSAVPAVASHGARAAANAAELSHDSETVFTVLPARVENEF